MQRHSFQALNSTFVVDSEYQFVKELGQGAYGCVVAAKHRRSGEGCAIKKITNINTKVGWVLWGRVVVAHSEAEDIDKAMLARDQVGYSRAAQAFGYLTSPPRLLHHFRGHKNVSSLSTEGYIIASKSYLDHMSVRHGHRLPARWQLRRSVPLCT